MAENNRLLWSWILQVKSTDPAQEGVAASTHDIWGMVGRLTDEISEVYFIHVPVIDTGYGLRP